MQAMRLSSDPRGVCLLRVARQRTGVLLTVVARADVEDSESQLETTTLDIEEALAEVRRFVDHFIAMHPPGNGGRVPDPEIH